MATVTATAKVSAATANWLIHAISGDNNTVTVVGDARGIGDRMRLIGTTASDGTYPVDHSGNPPTFDGTYTTISLLSYN